MGNTQFRPCNVSYHPTCFRLGAPFTCRRAKQAGLTFPPVKFWPMFICEVCTVRAVLGRELWYETDQLLLALERMRILDIAHSWAVSTHRQYQNRLRHLVEFHKSFRIPLGGPLHPVSPPVSRVIPLMWLHEYQALLPSARSRQEGPMIKQFGSIRGYRSAYSYLEALTTSILDPTGSHLNSRRQLLPGCSRVTDSAAFSFFSSGLQARLGDEARPSVALLFRHVAWLDRDLRERYASARSPMNRWQLALAGFANLLLWLGWLRAGELFALTWDDITYLPPAAARGQGVPRGGVFILTLQPETKGNRTFRPDIVISSSTNDGLRLDYWYTALLPFVSASTFVFRSPSRQWTSLTYRRDYFYPALRAQREFGDAFLIAFDVEGSSSLESKFYSLHSYRRGARSHVSKRRDISHRASLVQVYEHARWRRRRSGEAIDVMYREWTLADRVLLTLECM